MGRVTLHPLDLAACASAVRCVLRMVLACACLVVLVAALPAPAQAQDPLVRRQPTQGNGLPMLLQADEMIYDNQNNTVIARGNVEIYYNNYTLLADQVTYDQSANTLAAEGNVRIKDPDGSIIKADRITLTDDFRDGFLRSLQIVTEDESRIAAARAIREGGETTVFERGVFTACKPCEEDPSKPPTWRIKAYRVIHRKSEATISYQDAWFEFMGVPIAWVPYFQHADPTVKRKSGFLIPTLRSSDNLGFAVEQPYYFALAPNYDVTLSPIFTEKQGVLWQVKWRHRTENGRYQIELAGIDERDPLTDDAFRGSVKSEGDFNINAYWRWGWDVTFDTDDTFRRYYGLDDIYKTDRVSELYLEGIRGRNYFGAQIYKFGGLLSTDTDTSDYQVHPNIDYNYIFSNPVFGGELSFSANAVSLTRFGDDGTVGDDTDSSRVIGQVDWRRTLVDRLGQVYTPFVGARGDVYQVSDSYNPVTELEYSDDTVARGTAYAGVQYRYPFVAHGWRADHVVEPIAQIVTRPNVSYQSGDLATQQCGSGFIPNEDACSLVFDDTLLFDINKFSGYDRTESGTTADVGIRYTLQRHAGGYIQAIVGQSFHIAGENDFYTDSGLDKNQSDYVTGLYVQPSSYLSLIAQTRFDQDTLDIRRTDIAGSATWGPLSGSVAYASVDAQPGLGIDEPREEIQGTIKTLLTKYWSTFGSIRYDLIDEETRTREVGVRYADDCFILSLSYKQNYIEDQDIEPDQIVMLRFELKNLGAFEVSGDPRMEAESGSQ